MGTGVGVFSASMSKNLSCPGDELSRARVVIINTMGSSCQGTSCRGPVVGGRVFSGRFDVVSNLVVE